MSREADPTDPLSWLARAKSNLRLAELGGSQTGIFLEDLCFDAQQAAEKALKAACVHHELDFPVAVPRKDIIADRLTIDIFAATGASLPGRLLKSLNLVETSKQRL